MNSSHLISSHLISSHLISCSGYDGFGGRDIYSPPRDDPNWPVTLTDAHNINFDMRYTPPPSDQPLFFEPHLVHSIHLSFLYPNVSPCLFVYSLVSMSLIVLQDEWICGDWLVLWRNTSWAWAVQTARQ